jgi:hypothetical protein
MILIVSLAGKYTVVLGLRCIVLCYYIIIIIIIIIIIYLFDIFISRSVSINISFRYF